MKQGLAPLAQRWDELDAIRLRHVERIWEIVTEQGEIMTEVHKTNGKPGLDAFCEMVGISERHGYNLIRLFKHKENPFIRQLAQDKAVALLPAVEDDDVEVLDDRIVMAGGVELLLDDAQAMTREQLMGVVKKIKKLKRALAESEKAFDESRDLSNKESLELREQVEKLKRELLALKQESDDDPVDIMLDRASRDSMSLGKLLQSIKECDLNAEQGGRLQGILTHMITSCTNANPMVGNY
jgi:hypothetical protein